MSGKNCLEHDGCGWPEHLSRRTLLQAAGLAGLGWLTPLGRLLAQDAERNSHRPARSVIVLWLAGGPSQLETFDPHPGKEISHGTRAIKTALKGVQLAAGLERTAAILEDVSLIRSVVSKEGDHERASYNMKTGYRPDPTVVHPALGAVITHERPSPTVEIPTHVSILPNQWPARGGYLGASYDAFQVGNPLKPVPDVTAGVSEERQRGRERNLSVVERAFGRGRPENLDAERTLHLATMASARRMMTSDQLKAFDLSELPASERARFGDTPYGHGCLAAVRLVETGVRCVEITLNGWDTHANNHENHARLVGTLDPAFAATISELKRRGLLEHTVVLCGGEFGRTPKLNLLEGRDHWPKGFSVAITGGGIRRGQVVGATDPTGRSEEPDRPVRVQDIHATVLTALGIPADKEVMTPVGRPLALSDGNVIKELLA